MALSLALAVPNANDMDWVRTYECPRLKDGIIESEKHVADQRQPNVSVPR